MVNGVSHDSLFHALIFLTVLDRRRYFCRVYGLQPTFFHHIWKHGFASRLSLFDKKSRSQKQSSHSQRISTMYNVWIRVRHQISHGQDNLNCNERLKTQSKQRPAPPQYPPTANTKTFRRLPKMPTLHLSSRSCRRDFLWKVCSRI